LRPSASHQAQATIMRRCSLHRKGQSYKLETTRACIPDALVSASNYQSRLVEPTRLRAGR
jgi:hypothetical protein